MPGTTNETAHLPASLGLDSLGVVPWERLSHFRGSAEDIPELLAGLAEPSEKRRRALDGLWARIFHQGGRCSASVFAVPFLIGLLDDASARTDLLPLLRALAIGFDTDALEAFPTADDDQRVELFSGDNDRAVYAAVERGQSHYLSLLADAGGPVQAETAHLLACLSDAADRTLPPLVEAIDDVQHLALPSVLLAVSILGHRHPAPGRTSPSPHVVPVPSAGDPAGFAHHAARLILGDDSSAIDLLFSVVEDPPPVAGWSEVAPTLIGSVALSVRSTWLTDDCVAAIEALGSAESGARAWVAGVLLQAAFGTGRTIPATTEGLSELQRAVLDYLARCTPDGPGGWWSAPWYTALAPFLVPPTRETLVDYLDGRVLPECLPDGLARQFVEAGGERPER